MNSKTTTTATKEGARPALVPKLRFPEFREAEGWAEKAFGELLDDILDFRGRTPIKLGMEWGNRNITSLSANNVKNGFIDYKAECNLGSEELYQRWMGDVNLEKDDIVFTMEAPLGNALLLPDSQKYILSQRVVAFKTNSEVLNPFLVQLIWSEGFQDAINELATGSTAKGINQKALKTVPVKVPCPPEQQKIAECLSSVDELIAAQARKVDALKTHNKGLMQQLFPREGETQPRLRFPEFENAPAWKIKSLRLLCERIMDGTHFSPKTKEGPRPYLTSKNIRMGWLDLSTVSYIAEDEHRSIYARCPVKKNDVLLTKDGANTGNCAINTIDDEFSLLSSVAVLRGDSEQVMQQFLYQSIVSDGMQSTIVNSMSGQAFTRITLEKLGNYEIPFPIVSEQQRIADCLTSLDDLIAAQTQKHEALKIHKKGLMQQFSHRRRQLRHE